MPKSSSTDKKEKQTSSGEMRDLKKGRSNHHHKSRSDSESASDEGEIRNEKQSKSSRITHSEDEGEKRKEIISKSRRNNHHSEDESEMRNRKPRSSRNTHFEGEGEVRKEKSSKSDRNINSEDETNREKSSSSRKHKSKSNQQFDKDSDNRRQRNDSGDRQHGHEYKRYWGQGESENRHVKRNNDRYWNKYQGEESVGSRYYGESRDKENHQRKRRRENDSEDNHKESEGRNERNKPSENDKRNERDTVASNRTDPKKPQKPAMDMLTTKTGGAYIPPARLRMMQAQITDKSSAAYQRISWEALKKSIHGHINKVNTGNIGIIIRQLLKENVVRGRGLLCRSIIQAQAASITFTHVYAALVSVINSRFPRIGELLLKRLVIQFKRGFKRNDKSICISAATFVAHLVNQRVAHEILALEILTLLVESPTDDSVEVAIAFLKECGMKLLEVSNKGIHAIFEMLRNILHEGQLEKRVQYMIEVMFQVRKDNFKTHEAVPEGLELVQEEDQFTHLLTLEDVTDAEDLLNVFKLDPDFEENESKYDTLKKEILEESGDDSESGSGSEEDDSDDESESEARAKEETIIDNTETNLVALRRTIYLTIHSSLDFEECAHKLMRMELKPGQEIELCHMFLDCCAEQRTYEKFYGLLSQRFCQINKIFIPPFQQIFKDTYDTIHRLDTNKLRNVAKFFAHLLFTDAISWEVLSLIRLNEEETTSSSRIFIKILFQELSEYMGLTKLNERVKDVTLQAAFDGLFPRDDPKNTRFAINFFTSIGLGGLTDELREHLKTQSKVAAAPRVVATPINISSESSSSDSSSSSSSDSSSDSSFESESKKRSRKSKRSKKKKQTKKASKVSRNKSPVQSKHKSKKSRH